MVFTNDKGQAYPDTLVGTDSPHPDGQRPGRARLGRRRHRGRGGHARPAHLDAHPQGGRLQAVGRAARGLDRHRPGPDRRPSCCAATGWWASSSSSTGPGSANVPLENRATIGNMSPEYGSTVRHLPDRRRDAALPRASPAARPSWSPWSRPTPRSRGCGTTRPPSPRYSERVELDLAHGGPSLAGPRRPQDRVALTDARGGFRAALADMVPGGRRPAGRTRRSTAVDEDGPDEASAESFPASDPPAAMAGHDAAREPRPAPGRLVRARPRRGQRPADQAGAGRPRGRHRLRPRPRARGHRRHHLLHQHLQPVGDAGRRAAGPQRRRAGPDRPSRGSRPRWPPARKVVMDYYERAGLLPYLEKLGFHLVGLRLHHLHRQLRPAAPEISAAVERGRPGGGLGAVAATATSRAASTPTCRMNYLASPPLVVAYALAGHDGHRPARRAARPRPRRQPRLPARHLAVQRRGGRADRPGRPVRHVPQELRRGVRRATSAGTPWRCRPGRRFAWDDTSTYVRRPPYFDGMPASPDAGHRHRRAPGSWPCSATASPPTTSRPPGSIKRDSPAGRYLIEQGVGRAGLQLLRVPPRQPRGDDPRHLRQHPAPQPARARHRGRGHPAPARRASR